MNTQLSLLMYFSQAGLVVKTVMLILLTGSIASWTVIIQRWLYLSKRREETRAFERAFWSGNELSDIFESLEDQKREGMAALFYAGYDEYSRIQHSEVQDPRMMQDAIARAMRIAYSKEVDELEVHLPFLASVGSVSPYIGLFGTVWGIMASLQALGSVQQASIAMVAPGISEALVATAMGLFAAIPAFLAYNRLTTTVNTLLNSYETFQEELINILQRQV